MTAHTPSRLVAHPSRLKTDNPPQLPGDKSISHRALICAGLATGTSRIHGLLEAHDVIATAGAVSALGAPCRKLENGTWQVNGHGAWQTPNQNLNLANSGTGARLLLGALAGQKLSATICGDDSLSARPMKRVITPLAKMGAELHARQDEYLPVHIKGRRRLAPIDWRMRQASAQVKSAIMLAALAAPGETRITEPRPSRDHSERILPLFGADIAVSEPAEGEESAERTICVRGECELRGAEVGVPADPSAAAFVVVAHLLAGEGDLTLRGVGVNPHRVGLFTCLREMGAEIEFTPANKNGAASGGEPVADILVRPFARAPEGVRVDARRAPAMIDEYPVLAVVAAAARGVTRLEGLAELRHKESDRFAAILRLAGAAGAGAAHEDGDAIEVRGCGGPPAGGGCIDAGGDHRIAMSALVLGLGCRRAVEVSGAEWIATSFPDFVGTFSALGARIEATD